MARVSELVVVRGAHAKQIMAAAGVSDRPVEATFAAVRRENGRGGVLRPA
jgi:hypothetical protein